MISPKAILITGASSGLGAALALHYASPGITLFLSGRHEARLQETADLCRARGATVHAQIIETQNRAAMALWIASCDAIAPLDLVIANAGISGGTDGANGESADQARRIFAVNLDGVLNTIDPVLPLMAARGRGQIATMSSLASFSGWPGAPAYSASKGAVRLYGEALRGAYAPRGIAVNVICPGFVKTPMTDVNPFPMPFLMTADRAARIIAAGLARNRARIAFPAPTYMAVGLIGLLPATVGDALRRLFPAKPVRS